MPQLISNSKRDKLLLACEALVLEGKDSPSEVSTLLNISFNTAKSYLSIIQQRWSNTNDYSDLKAKRQDLILKTQKVLKDAFEQKNQSKNVIEANQSLRTVLLAIERLQKLNGLDKTEDEVPNIKIKEMQIFTYAQQINQLPVDQKDLVMSKVRDELKKRKGKVNQFPHC